MPPERADEPPFDCPGGPGINVDTTHHLAQCPGPCGTWFTTMMDEPVFPPHTVTGTTIDWGFKRG